MATSSDAGQRQAFTQQGVPYSEMMSDKMSLSFESLKLQHANISHLPKPSNLVKFNLHLSLLVPGPLSAWHWPDQSTTR